MMDKIVTQPNKKKYSLCGAIQKCNQYMYIVLLITDWLIRYQIVIQSLTIIKLKSSGLFSHHTQFSQTSFKFEE